MNERGRKKRTLIFFLFHESFQGNSSLCQLVRNYFISLRLVRLLTHHLLMAGCYSPLVRPALCAPYLSIFPVLQMERKHGNFARPIETFFSSSSLFFCNRADRNGIMPVLHKNAPWSLFYVKFRTVWQSLKIDL